MGSAADKKTEEIHEKEQHLLKLIRQIEYGELRIIVADGLPVRVEETVKSIKL